MTNTGRNRVPARIARMADEVSRLYGIARFRGDLGSMPEFLDVAEAGSKGASDAVDLARGALERHMKVLRRDSARAES